MITLLHTMLLKTAFPLPPDRFRQTKVVFTLPTEIQEKYKTRIIWVNSS